MLGDHSNIRETDPDLMRRAVAFCPRIKDSKKISEAFNQIGKDYVGSLPADGQDSMVRVDTQHIDGTMDTTKREELLAWLKSDSDANDCRVLTNVRCLSEGVDVPSLDAVMFLSPRNSQIDVVQSVGRVMRRAPNKKYGYIIIPVVVPSETKPEDALDDNERFKVVWTVLNALRAHDDRFNATVNKLELNIKKPDNIIIGAPEYTFDDGGAPQAVQEPETAYTTQTIQAQFTLQFEQLKGLIYARMVEKVGDKRYWEQWAKNVAEIAERHVERIKRLIKDKGKHAKAFEEFLDGLRKNINPSIDEQDAIDMLSQHVITKPVFDALFEGYSFVAHNAVSASMQNMLNLLEEQAMEKDAEALEKFYESVKMRAAGIDNAAGKQRIIIELYDKFFKTAFPKMVEQLGIVYTPVEVVDFIIHSVNDILRKEFGRTISDENVHILDPFTGTGTFIVRLLQSGLISPEDLERKYKHELHANEIVLLAYYIAAINIENAYHDATPDPDDGIGKATYTPFDGIVLTDTFQLGETEHTEQLSSEMFPQNSERVVKQKRAPIRVIMGNPPYSVGQKSANDNAQNQKYLKLDQRIANTYAKATEATNKNSLYDSYIKAFRWSSDRLGKNGGVICFVSNGAWIDGNAQDGFRKVLEQEFSAIYVFNLRGNQRTSGELSRKEGGKIFGSGSRTPIAITLLVKKAE
jgi:predicted helicase